MAIRHSATVDQRVCPASGSVYAEMLAGATRAISVCAIRVTTLSNLGGEIAIARSFAIGTGAASGIATGVSHRIGGQTGVGTAGARLQAAWTSSGVSPTGYASRLRSEILPTATGTIIDLWREDDGPILVEPGQSLLLVNAGSGVATGSGIRVNFTWSEGAASDR